MTKDQFERMKDFSASMSIARKMLAEHIINEADYDKLEAAFAERYNPPLVFISPQEALL